MLVIVVLLITGVSYSSYNASANCISFLLTPATICLAVPLYQQVELLKRNYKAVLIGISSGCACQFVLCIDSGNTFSFGLMPLMSRSCQSQSRRR